MCVFNQGKKRKSIITQDGRRESEAGNCRLHASQCISTLTLLPHSLFLLAMQDYNKNMSFPVSIPRSPNKGGPFGEAVASERTMIRESGGTTITIVLRNTNRSWKGMGRDPRLLFPQIVFHFSSDSRDRKDRDGE